MRRVWVASMLAASSACAGILSVDQVQYSDGLDAGPRDATSSGDETTATSDASDAACSADLANDPSHCGRCDRSCGPGGRCSDGACAPELVMSGPLPGPANLGKIAVGNGSVYVVGDDGLRRCPVTGCGDAAVLMYTPTASEVMASVALDDAGVYPVIGAILPNGTDCRIVRCTATSCTSAPAVIAAQPDVMAVEASGGRVYWGIRSVFAGTAEVSSCPVDGCDGGPRQEGRHLLFSLTTSIVPANDAVLWACGNYVLRSTPGGTQVMATTGASTSARAIAREGDRLFWTNPEVGSIEACTMSTQCQDRSTLVANQTNPTTMVLDGPRLIWGSEERPDGGADGGMKRGTIASCPTRDGTDITTLARTSASPMWVAVDATHVYWSDAAGSVWRVVK